jgi:endonuclease/exonuclease/phosphatase family metal-dependent hydrolase
VPGSQSWDSSLPRVATWVRLRDRRDDGREVLFVNTHWDHVGRRARLESAGLIRRHLKDAGIGASVIVAGDLNCTEDDEPYSVLCGSSDDPPQLVDAFRAANPVRGADEVTFHNFRGTAAGSRIDFILHSKELVAITADIDRTAEGAIFPSDHYAVTAVLRREPR